MFPSQSPTRTNIEEANKHLQLLHARIMELEQTVKSQADEFQTLCQKKDADMALKVTELKRAKDGEIKDLRHRLDVSERQVQKLTHRNKDKDAVIASLQEKCKWADELLSYYPILHKLTSTMEMIRNTPKSGTPSHETSSRSARSKASLNGGGDHHSPDAVDSSAPSIQYMAKTFHNSVRHFSISEDEGMDDDAVLGPEEVMRLMKRDKELYL